MLTLKGIKNWLDSLFKEQKEEANGMNQTNGKDYRRVLVIGDIHGNYRRFQSLYSKLQVSSEDLVIFLGDYIDRGNDNLLMLRWIMRESQNENIIALRGNHEQMMLDYYQDDDLNWIFNGGNHTHREIKVKLKENPNLLAEILEFADGLPLSYRRTVNGKDYYFCHAGVDPKKPLEEQDEMSLLWIREEFFKHYDGDSIIVTGHTPILLLNPEGSLEFWCRDSKIFANKKNIRPQWRRGGKILLMDTGSYFPNGCISCIDLISGRVETSDE